MASTSNKNPHFDDGILVWSDQYSGLYEPPPQSYGAQFDEKWRLVLEDTSGAQGFNQGLGVQLDEQAIECLIYEWTARSPAVRDPAVVCPARQIDGKVRPELIEGKDCIDIGCGSGRWTKVLQTLGAGRVLSVDISAHSLQGVRSFNPDTLEANVLRLSEDHPELVDQFDFANLWGVAQHTHDPRAAFMSAASTVKPGGHMYLMVYAPEGMHNTKLVNHFRTTFKGLETAEERLAYAEAIHERRWLQNGPLGRNLINAASRLLGRPNWGVKIGVLDMLMPFYNWTIPLEVARGWFEDAGFSDIEVLNETRKVKAAHHILGRRS